MADRADPLKLEAEIKQLADLLAVRVIALLQTSSKHTYKQEGTGSIEHGASEDNLYSGALLADVYRHAHRTVGLAVGTIRSRGFAELHGQRFTLTYEGERAAGIETLTEEAARQLEGLRKTWQEHRAAQPQPDFTGAENEFFGRLSEFLQRATEQQNYSSHDDCQEQQEEEDNP